MIEAIEARNLLRRTAKISKLMREALEQLKKSHRVIGDIRGRGIMQAIELVKYGLKSQQLN